MWLTGYSKEKLDMHLAKASDFESFFNEAKHFNPNSSLIKGLICGIRVEDIEDPIIQKLRYMDKVVDELARGKKMENMLRKPK